MCSRLGGGGRRVNLVGSEAVLLLLVELGFAGEDDAGVVGEGDVVHVHMVVPGVDAGGAVLVAVCSESSVVKLAVRYIPVSEVLIGTAMVDCMFGVVNHSLGPPLAADALGLEDTVVVHHPVEGAVGDIAAAAAEIDHSPGMDVVVVPKLIVGDC